jgi:hypothetical protein
MISIGLSETEVIQFQNAAIVEQIHVDTLVQVIQSLGQQPLTQPQFFFQFNTPVDFVEQVVVQEQYLHPLSYRLTAELPSARISEQRRLSAAVRSFHRLRLSCRLKLVSQVSPTVFSVKTPSAAPLKLLFQLSK